MEVENSRDTAVTFLQAIFDERDTVVFRPIETWTEGDAKKSRVLYKSVLYRAAKPLLLQMAVDSLLKTSEAERANVFFGVCPRFGSNGRFDLAWQIRVVRVLWADIDHETVDGALKRVEKAGLPKPSLVVNSGNGVHLYWLLDCPVTIDDGGDPPAVETEWVEKSGGGKRPRKYFLDNGDRVYLDKQPHASRLSPKAQHLQDIIAGIATAIGGDHTIDLSRLLRVPGTLNRKNERNGQEPRPTQLIECDASRRYPISTFEPFAARAPQVKVRQQIAAMPLPRTRKLSANRSDKLAQLVAASAIAPAGTRSEADFAVCCYAIRNGIAKEEVWAQVEQVGKFADHGRRYFDLTWENAEHDVRVGIYDKLQKCSGPKAKTIGGNQPAEPISDDFGEGEIAQSGGRPVINVEPQTMPVGDSMRQITERLLTAGNCFNRADQLVVVNGEAISPILAAPELAGLLNHHVEFYFIGEKVSEYQPLPSKYGNTWLHHPAERLRLPTIKLFTRNPVYTDDWRLMEPGFDAASGIYYAGPRVEPRDGTEHLDALLRDFCFKTPADRTNYIGMLLTIVLVPRFIGSKPAVLFNGNQPELGKSILAQIIAILRDGHPTETATYNPNDEEFEKRLGAIVRRGATTIIIDNAKARGGRTPKIESACLERCVTDPILSFRLLGFSSEIRAENSHIFCLTANSTDVSRDLVTRSAVVNMYYEGDPERRTFGIADPEGYAQEHRVELLGELIGMVERWKAGGMRKAVTHNRFNKRGWGNIVGGILDASGEPDFLANAEEAAAQLDETRREFAELVQVLVDHPQGIWTATELVNLCNSEGLLATDLGEGSPRSLATKMGTLAGRFVSERFTLPDGRHVVFHRGSDRKGNTYRVFVPEDVPNLEAFAEPMPNLAELAGSAP